MKDNIKKLTVVIDRIVDNTATLQFADERSILWPKEKLPASVQEGDVLSITIRLAQEIKKKKIQKIKGLLENKLKVKNEK